MTIMNLKNKEYMNTTTIILNHNQIDQKLKELPIRFMKLIVLKMKL